MHRSTPSIARRATRLVVVAVAATILAGCAAPVDAGSSAPGSPDPAPAPATEPQTELATLPEPLPSGEVVGQGLVLDASVPALCLGDVGASLPPTCGGIPLAGWDWQSLDGWEEQSGTCWRSYAVQGAWDGETLVVSGEPIPLALYDPAPLPQEDTVVVTTPQAELERIQTVLHEALGERLLSSSIAEGILRVTVVYDDGTLQAHLDDAYGQAVVRVESALRDAAA